MASNFPDSEIDQAIASTIPKNTQSVEEAMDQLPVDTEYQCIFETGEQISIKKSVVEKIPYLQLFFQPENDGEAHFKPPPKNESGQYIFPPEIEFRYLKPILAYVASGKPLDLVAKLSAKDNVLDLIAFFDFLLMKKPDVADLDTIRKRTTEDIVDYTEKIVRKCYNFHNAHYGRQEAREAAGEFCIGLAMGIYDLSNANRQKMFSRMEFILSHPRTFRRRLRHHAKAIADVKLTWLTQKQRQLLEKWTNKFSDEDADEVDTEDGSGTDRSASATDDYDSDCDYTY